METIRKENSNIWYEVNEEEGIVSACFEFRDIIADVHNALVDKRGICIDVLASAWDKVPDEQKSHTYVATAVCSPNDTFDLETGKRIARERLLEKYYKARINYLRKVGDELSHQLDFVEDQMSYSWLNIDKFTKANKKTLEKNKG